MPEFIWAKSANDGSALTTRAGAALSNQPGQKLRRKVKQRESLVEFWLRYRRGWDPTIFTGQSAPWRRAYKLSHSRSLLFQLNPKVEVLHVRKWGRFGNALRQLHNAIYVAEILDARTIEFSEKHPFLSGNRAGQISLEWESNHASAPTLKGKFDSLDTFRCSVDWRDTARIFADHIRPLVKPKLRIPDPRLRDDDLVLHFRAGDVFTGKVHSIYGQPPLAYYLSAVEREQPSRVWLVFEDRNNPCIDAVEGALRARGVDVVTQSGTLVEDLRFLLSAGRIVAGRGTFLRMTSHLSDRLRRIYFFEEDSLSLCEMGVDVVKAVDADGEFKSKVIRDNWTNSLEQRALILSYPSQKLTFKPARRDKL